VCVSEATCLCVCVGGDMCVCVCVREARRHACDAEHREVGQDFEVPEEAERKEDGGRDESEQVVPRRQPSYTHTHTHLLT
jgi:hypothetical protein